MIQALTSSKGSHCKSDCLSTHNLASQLRMHGWTRDGPVAIGSVQCGQGVHPFLANTYKRRYRQVGMDALNGMREKLYYCFLVGQVGQVGPIQSNQAPFASNLTFRGWTRWAPAMIRAPA
jgi:hypothetical protein